MRWTDLPPDRRHADSGRTAVSRGEWDDLRQRLERLPPGHPSRPGDEDEVQAQDWRAGQSQADRADDEGEDPAEDGQADQARPGERGSPTWRGVRDDEAGWPREPGGHRERDAGPLLPDRRGPYRPWFSGDGPPEPWFVADPDPGAEP